MQLMSKTTYTGLFIISLVEKRRKGLNVHDKATIISLA